MANSTRTALVTGANRGIGLEIAKGLAQGGLRVLAAARIAEEAEKAAREIGDDVIGVVLDLSEPEAAGKRAMEIDAQYGPVDVLVNNAGVMFWGGGLEISADDMGRSFAVNTLAPHALIRALAPGMRERGYGRIVNVSSGWGSFSEGLEGPMAYAASKAALNAITVKFGEELKPAVKINAACPGWVRTRMGGDQAPRSPEKGAETPIWLATLPDDGPTGGFFRDHEPLGW